jgi:hypothetical protein
MSGMLEPQNDRLYAAVEHHAAEKWHKRLTIFLQADRVMRRYHLVMTLSRCVLFCALGVLGFIFSLPQVLPEWVFSICIGSGIIALLVYLFCFTLAKVSRAHRNQLARRFYENNVNIEYHADAIQLRHRSSSKIICQKSDHE